MSCCPPDLAPGGSSVAAVSEEAASHYPDDPTLDECCQRDLQQQRRIAVVKAKLLSMDRTTERTKLQQRVLHTSPPHAEQQDIAESEEGSDAWDEDDENDIGEKTQSHVFACSLALVHKAIPV